MTLEMPFKDNRRPARRVYGWSPERSKFLACSCLDALCAILPEFKKAASKPEGEKRLMPTLVLLRHGQSQWNLENRFTGWWDVDCRSRADRSAGRGKLLKERGYDFDRCFTSVLTRAIRTLHLVLHEMDQPWLPTAKDWHLNERHYGGLTGLNKPEMIDKVGAEQVKIWRRSFDIRRRRFRRTANMMSAATVAMPGLPVPNTESLKETIARALALLRSGDRPGAARRQARPHCGAWQFDSRHHQAFVEHRR